MRWFTIYIALIFLAALPARSEEVVVGLSQNRVSLTVNYEGSEILIFGAVRRESPLPDDSALDIVVTIEGPPTSAVIWRKARRAGIWVNTESQEMRAAPSFYTVASTAPLSEILSPDADLTHRISTRLAIFEARGSDPRDAAAFTEAMIRIRQSESLYQELDGAVSLQRDTLFNTRVILPKNIVEGIYTARILLLRDGEVIDEAETFIDVQKAVLERWLYNMAYDYPPLYGLLALSLAVFFGWGASALFRFVRS
ncbi:TIGR02186 family protein [Roseinatronobacter alkalisoli]|uniref:TIGR02186 family protein n=1 Tax=Roseinatronobacter alkalisoli TaxID=3028235 RepID=A0ABT5T5G8_9RHOB|nr:TIGR02186 family protein [Roseinatronobacter sp. HJB301]MDD7970365.1 TIGR02186 family protein [Roseinatronobacter sp. HJB301]